MYDSLLRTDTRQYPSLSVSSVPAFLLSPPLLCSWVALCWACAAESCPALLTTVSLWLRWSPCGFADLLVASLPDLPTAQQANDSDDWLLRKSPFLQI